ncbi:hypothetical protein LV564_01525 [Komagataeibacter nataicola]|uniref:hypothetical protein n=1 Tax=Komagataeibacter nataicola TaxID=265960 RepID=UPI0011B49718|nr:hypothetical protein [Komagataeibacter nataicola]WEQ55824.1 hypothetical protein LV564_01525 [Komagataeibacter nataicola]WNM09314.1 hypothetical protein RI056_04850 [Komagataeibacter nataicola]
MKTVKVSGCCLFEKRRHSFEALSWQVFQTVSYINMAGQLQAVPPCLYPASWTGHGGRMESGIPRSFLKEASPKTSS